ncbi:MAG: RecB family exonuclease [Candidatus Latescibacterota bacterium]
MDFHALRDRPHLSASAIHDYLECGLRYRLARVEKRKPDCVPDSLLFGTVIHRSLKMFHRERMAGNRVEREELLRSFERFWREDAEDRTDLRYGEGKTFENYLALGKELLATYYDEAPRDGFRVIAVEEPFRLAVEGVSAPIIGVIDLVEEDSQGTIVVSDFKTTSRAFSPEEVNRSMQLTLYGMAVRAGGFSDREILVRFDCLVKTKVPGFRQYYSIRTPEDEARAVRKIRHIWDGIMKGVFIPDDHSWKCPRCEYRTGCDAWFSGREDEGVHADAQ